MASVGPGRAAMPTTPVIHFTPSTLITEEPPKCAEEHSHNFKQIEGHAWSSTQSLPHPPCLVPHELSHGASVVDKVFKLCANRV